MPQVCAALNCNEKKTKDSKCSFHCFPKDPKRRKMWVSATRRLDFVPSLYNSLCSNHFKAEDYDRTRFGLHPSLRKDAVPSVFDFESKIMKRTRQCRPREILLDGVLGSTPRTRPVKQLDRARPTRTSFEQVFVKMEVETDPSSPPFDSWPSPMFGPSDPFAVQRQTPFCPPDDTRLPPELSKPWVQTSSHALGNLHQVNPSYPENQAYQESPRDQWDIKLCLDSSLSASCDVNDINSRVVKSTPNSRDVGSPSRNEQLKKRILPACSTVVELQVVNSRLKVVPKSCSRCNETLALDSLAELRNEAKVGDSFPSSDIVCSVCEASSVSIVIDNQTETESSPSNLSVPLKYQSQLRILLSDPPVDYGDQPEVGTTPLRLVPKFCSLCRESLPSDSSVVVQNKSKISHSPPLLMAFCFKCKVLSRTSDIVIEPVQESSASQSSDNTSRDESIQSSPSEIFDSRLDVKSLPSNSLFNDNQHLNVVSKFCSDCQRMSGKVLSDSCDALCDRPEAFGLIVESSYRRIMDRCCSGCSERACKLYTVMERCAQSSRTPARVPKFVSQRSVSDTQLQEQHERNWDLALKTIDSQKRKIKILQQQTRRLRDKMIRLDYLSKESGLTSY